MKRLAQYKPVPECACSDCVGACEQEPGWFAPGEVAKLAEHLGLTVQETFDKYLVVDWWVASPYVYVLAPGLVGEPTGTMAPNWPDGRCVFLTEGKCSIHEVKPTECRLAGHRKDKGWLRESMADAWNNKDAQREAVDLLNSKQRKIA